MLDLFRAIFAPPRDLILPLLAAWVGMLLTGQRARRTGTSDAGLDAVFAALAITFLVSGRHPIRGGTPDCFHAEPQQPRLSQRKPF